MRNLGLELPLAVRIALYVLSFLFTFLTIAPLIWLTYSAFKPHADIIHNIFAVPNHFYFQNFIRSWKLGNLGLYTLNSMFYAITATVLTVYFALAAGFALVKFGYKKISSVIYGFFIMGLLITIHAVLVPLFILEARLNIDDTRLGVLLPYIAFALPFMIYLATTYVRSVPDSLIDSAFIDGAGYFSIFHLIVIPISRPIIATMGIFSFLGNWNEFVFVFVLTTREELRSLPVGINAFSGGMARDFGLLFAALVIATIPMLIFYILFYRQIARGFVAGAIKE